MKEQNLLAMNTTTNLITNTNEGAGLFYFGLRLPVDQNTELRSAGTYGAYGFSVEVTFTNGDTAYYANVSEVHANYKPGMIAIESNYHSTGVTWNLDRVFRLNIHLDSRHWSEFDLGRG